MNRQAAQVFIRDPVEYRLLAHECVKRHSAEALIRTTPQLVLTLFCRSLGGTLSISGVNVGGIEAAVVEVERCATVSDVHTAFCCSLERSLETVSLILPEGITLMDAMENVKAIGAISERRNGLSFDELLQRNLSNEAAAASNA